MRRAWIIVALFAVGCAADPAGDTCTAAADHVASCTGETMQAATTCDLERAEAVLAMDCDELAATAATAKADGWWDDFLCALGFASHCSTDGGGGSDAPTLRTLSGHVYRVGTFDQPVSNVYVRATREGTTQTKGVWVVQGLFAITDLTPARYRIEVAYTPTSSVLASTTVDVAAQSYVVLHAPVP